MWLQLVRESSSRVRLRAGVGEVILNLSAPRTIPGVPSASPYGDASLEAPDPNNGGAFVEAIADSLGVIAPPGEQGELEAFRCGYFSSGESNVRLILWWRGIGVQLQVRFDDDRGVAEMQWHAVRPEDVVRVLARAVRDGRPTRRTPMEDPSLEDSIPMWSELRPVPGAPGAAHRPVAFAGDSLITGVDHESDSKILYWSHPGEAPHELCVLPHRTGTIVAAPDCHRVLFTQAEQRNPFRIGEQDRGHVFLVDMDGAAVRPVVSSTPDFEFNWSAFIVWSPDSSRFALGGIRPNTTRIYRADDLAIIGASRPMLGVLPFRWDDRGLISWVTRFSGSTKSYERVYLRWAGDENFEEVTLPGIPSPDGRLFVRWLADGIEVIDSTGKATTFMFRHEDEIAALAQMRIHDPVWLGPHELLCDGEDLMVLNLETLRSRYLCPC